MPELEPLDVTVKNPEAPAQVEMDLGQDMSIETPVKQAVPERKDNEAIETLRRQLDDKRREAEEARRQKAESDKIAAERATEVKTYQVQAQDNQLTAFVNAIASFERDAEMLERDYANTLAEGDYNKAAKLQRQMSQVESKLIQLAQGREALSERLQQERQMLENQRRQPVQQPQQQYQDPVEQHISKLSPASQHWLRQHREVLTDPALNAHMTSAHYEAVRDQIELDSPEYFAYIEDRLGYGSKPSPVAANPRSTRNTMSAAPVSRSNGAQNLRNGNTVTVTLNPAQRQMARDLDMSDEEYLEGMLYQAQKGAMEI